MTFLLTDALKARDAGASKNGDPKTEKGPHGDPGLQMGTHVGAVHFQ